MTAYIERSIDLRELEACECVDLGESTIEWGRLPALLDAGELRHMLALPYSGCGRGVLGSDRWSGEE